MMLLLLQFLAKLRLNKSSKEINRVLVVRLYGIGNCIWASAYLNSLLKSKPGIKIDVLGEKRGIGLIENSKKFKVFSFNSLKGRNVFWKIKNLSKLKDYDLIYLAFPFKDINLLVYLRLFFSCPIVGFQEDDPLLLQSLKMKDTKQHEVVENLNALSFIFDTNLEQVKPELSFSDNGSIDLDNRYFNLGIHAGVFNQFERCWDPIKFQELIEQIQNELSNLQVLLFGVDKEFDLNQKIKGNFSFVKNYAGQYNLEETAKIISQLNFFIGTDSALIHIASCFGIKTLSLFGPTDDVKSHPWMPMAANKIVSSKISCRPCYRFGTKIDCHQKIKFQCMKDIEVNEVYKNFKELLYT